MELTVLHQSENFIIVNKLPDLIINSDDPTRLSLQRQLVSYFPQFINERLHFGFYFPHRLDFATSGIMCIALSKKACAAASFAFQHRLTKKFYLALVNGLVYPNEITIEIPIGEAEDVKVMKEYGHNSRYAITKLLVLQHGTYFNSPVSKVLLLPLTGRRHQLRIHCRCIGHSILGDFIYNKDIDLPFPRMFLHSYRLSMPNSIENIDITSDDPFDSDKVKEWHPKRLIHPLNESIMEYLSRKTS